MPRASEIVQLVGRPDSAVMRAVRETLGAIDHAHALPRAVPLVVRVSRARREDGSFSTSRSGATISLSRFAPQPRLTFAHEFGHYIDSRMLQPLQGAFASEYEDSLVPLAECWMKSAEVQRVQHVLRVRGRLLTVDERRFLAESLLPEELFARTYAQWLAVRSGLAPLAEELENRRRNRGVFGGVACSFVWERESFKPIMNAVDELFGSKGFL